MKTNLDLYGQSERALSFAVADAEYCVEMAAVVEVRRLTPWLVADDVPAAVRGYIDYYGRAVPIVDLRRRDRRRHGEIDPSMRVIVVNFDDLIVGVLADQIFQVCGAALQQGVRIDHHLLSAELQRGAVDG